MAALLLLLLLLLCRQFTDAALGLSLTILNSLIDLVSFSGILYSIYPPLFAALLAYSIGGTVGSVWLGKVSVHEGLQGLANGLFLACTFVLPSCVPATAQANPMMDLLPNPEGGDNASARSPLKQPYRQAYRGSTLWSKDIERPAASGSGPKDVCS